MIVGSYTRFFTGEELEEIIQMITLKDFEFKKFNGDYRTFFVQEQDHLPTPAPPSSVVTSTPSSPEPNNGMYQAIQK